MWKTGAGMCQRLKTTSNSRSMSFHKAFRIFQKCPHASFEHFVSFWRKYSMADKCRSQPSETNQLLVQKYPSEAFDLAAFLLLPLKTTGSCRECWGLFVLRGNQKRGVRSTTYHQPGLRVADSAPTIIQLFENDLLRLHSRASIRCNPTIPTRQRAPFYCVVPLAAPNPLM